MPLKWTTLLVWRHYGFDNSKLTCSDVECELLNFCELIKWEILSALQLTTIPMINLRKKTVLLRYSSTHRTNT